MRIAILMGAALMTTAGIAATPAEAQRHGGYDRGDRGWQGDREWQRGRGDRWQGNRNWRGDRGWRGDRRWQGNRGYGWNGGQRWNNGYGRTRVVCQIVRGYYGPERQCYRVYR